MRNHRLGRRTTFAKKLVTSARLVKTTIINTVKKVYYYYSSGGIGVGNLIKRYSTYIPRDWTNGGDYYYIKTVNNNVSVPPFSYDWTSSSYTLWINANTITGVYTPVQIPFDKIEYGANWSSIYQFDRYTNWQPIDIITQKHELMRNGYIRIKRSDLDNLSGGFGYSSPYLKSSEVWGTGVYPTGVTYTESSITDTDGAWTISAVPNKPIINSVTPNNNGTANLNYNVDTGGVNVTSIFVRVYDITGVNQLAGTSIVVNLYGQNVNQTSLLQYLTVGESYTIRILAINNIGTSITSDLSSVFVA